MRHNLLNVFIKTKRIHQTAADVVSLEMHPAAHMEPGSQTNVSADEVFVEGSYSQWETFCPPAIKSFVSFKATGAESPH